MQTTPLLRLTYLLMAVGFLVMGWALLPRSTGAGLSTMLMAIGPVGGVLKLKELSPRVARLFWVISWLAGLIAATFYAMADQWVNSVAFIFMSVGFGVLGLAAPGSSTTPSDEPAERRS